MNTEQKKVLISGASFAGLSTAYWMSQAGYDVMVVEIAKQLKKGGTPVNIVGDTIEVVKRMGLLDQIEANKILMEVLEFKNAAGQTERLDYIQKNQEAKGAIEYEIERDTLLNILYEAVERNVKFVFDEHITGMTETADCMEVSFKNAPTAQFDLVFGCDGIHSAVRKYWFGEEKQFSHFLQTYFSITVVDKLLIGENTIQLYSEPGKSVMLNAYNHKTDIVLCFFSEHEIPYDYRNEAQQRNIILNQFAGTGWRTPELLEELKQSETFYFDKLCQMKMPSWTKGRVALVGDAGYCASPAAGRGGSLAIDGAAALANAFQKHNGDFELAFLEYNQSFRPFVEQLQADVINFNLDMLVPKTEEAVQKRNRDGFF